MIKEQNKTVIFTALGGALEFYDFTVYALFASYISMHFFPANTPLIGLINTFLVFALGYLARPLGGIVFGHLGNKFGQKSVGVFSILTMAFSTLLIGCLPDYYQMGMLSPFCLIILRLLQGISAGAELPGTALLTMENLPSPTRGFSIGLIFMSVTLGNSMGALVGLLLTFLLSNEQMSIWGWRIPFILGFFLGILSYIINQKSSPAPVFLTVKETASKRKSLLRLLQASRKCLLKGFLLTAIPASTISLFLYLPTYLGTILQEDVPHVYFISLMAFISLGLMTGFFGWGSNFISRRKLLITGALLFIVSSYPLFCGLARLGGSFVWVFSLGFATSCGMINGSYVVLIAEFFPPAIRYIGMGLSYSLGVALFGGLAPLVFTWLIQYFKMLEAPALFLLGCGILNLLSIFIKERSRCCEMNSCVVCQ